MMEVSVLDNLKRSKSATTLELEFDWYFILSSMKFNDHYDDALYHAQELIFYDVGFYDIIEMQVPYYTDILMGILSHLHLPTHYIKHAMSKNGRLSYSRLMTFLLRGKFHLHKNKNEDASLVDRLIKDRILKTLPKKSQKNLFEELVTDGDSKWVDIALKNNLFSPDAVGKAKIKYSLHEHSINYASAINSLLDSGFNIQASCPQLILNDWCKYNINASLDEMKIALDTLNKISDDKSIVGEGTPYFFEYLLKHCKIDHMALLLESAGVMEMENEAIALAFASFVREFPKLINFADTVNNKGLEDRLLYLISTPGIADCIAFLTPSEAVKIFGINYRTTRAILKNMSESAFEKSIKTLTSPEIISNSTFPIECAYSSFEFLTREQFDTRKKAVCQVFKHQFYTDDFKLFRHVINTGACNYDDIKKTSRSVSISSLLASCYINDKEKVARAMNRMNDADFDVLIRTISIEPFEYLPITSPNGQRLIFSIITNNEKDAP